MTWFKACNWEGPIIANSAKVFLHTWKRVGMKICLSGWSLALGCLNTTVHIRTLSNNHARCLYHSAMATSPVSDGVCNLSSQCYMTIRGIVFSAHPDSRWAALCFVFYSTMVWIQDLVFPLTSPPTLFSLFTLRQDPTKLIFINID